MTLDNTVLLLISADGGCGLYSGASICKTGCRVDEWPHFVIDGEGEGCSSNFFYIILFHQSPRLVFANGGSYLIFFFVCIYKSERSHHVQRTKCQLSGI